MRWGWAPQEASRNAWLAGALHYFPGAMVELAPAPVVLGLAGMELTFPAAGLFSAIVQNH